VRSDELPATTAKAAPKAARRAAPTARPDSDFLQRQGGIY
jgi:hypothetical protein